MNTPLWEPPEQRVNNSNLLNFSKFVGFKTERDFKKIWQWSISKPEIFWSKFWDYSKIIGNKGKEIIRKDKTFNTVSYTHLTLPTTPYV